MEEERLNLKMLEEIHRKMLEEIDKRVLKEIDTPAHKPNYFTKNVKIKSKKKDYGDKLVSSVMINNLTILIPNKTISGIFTKGKKYYCSNKKVNNDDGIPIIVKEKMFTVCKD